MITFLFALSLACGVPEPSLADHEIRQALNGNLPMNRQAIVETFGSQRADLSTEPSTDGSTSYRVWVDPMYDHDCFERRVVETLSDARSWPNLRQASGIEVPQFWVTLVAPGATCAKPELMSASCAYGTGDGTGIVRLNSLRWLRGHGYLTPTLEQSRTINHEVGHILGHDHVDCTVMGWTPWRSESGWWPKWDVEHDTCDPVVWPAGA